MIEDLRELGDAMAAAISERWTGPGGCDCRVCRAAHAWNEHRARETEPGFEACGRGICAKHDGHDGPCDY